MTILPRNSCPNLVECMWKPLATQQRPVALDYEGVQVSKPNPHKPIVHLLTPEVVERFWSRVDKGVDDDDCCWLWSMKLGAHGYGVIVICGVAFLASRVSLTMKLGRDISPGYQCGHVCHDEAAIRGECSTWIECVHHGCVRPSHLAEQTPKTNSNGSPNVIYTIRSNQTHCFRGHPFVPGNFRTRPSWPENYRECLVCAKYGGLVRTAIRKAAYEALGMTCRGYMKTYGNAEPFMLETLEAHGIDAQSVIDSVLMPELSEEALQYIQNNMKVEN